jgi:hypothetical protein
VQEEIEVKWGELLGVVALTTNQPYFSTVVATGEWGPAWLRRVVSPFLWCTRGPGSCLSGMVTLVLR